jgi:hypothetical protein
MERSPRTIAEANQLLQLGELLTETIRTVIDEWSREKYTKQDASMMGANKEGSREGSHQSSDRPQILPSWRLHQAQRTILAITGALTELVAEPDHRLQEFSAQYWESRDPYCLLQVLLAIFSSERTTVCHLLTLKVLW